MNRQNPKKSLILEMTGDSQHLTEQFVCSLKEVSLGNIYPYLDFKELAAFAIGSRKERKEDMSSFETLLKRADNDSLYELFNHVFGGFGMKSLNKYSAIGTSNAKLYDSLNPYHASNLKLRLDKVESGLEVQLREMLKEPVSTWVFDCNYRREKSMRGGDNHRLYVMEWQPVYPKNGTVHAGNNASEIVKVVKNYPTILLG